MRYYAVFILLIRFTLFSHCLCFVAGANRSQVHFNTTKRRHTLSVVCLFHWKYRSSMTFSFSPFAVGAGASFFSACWALFGASVGMFQPKLLYDEEELKPFYDWYFMGLLNGKLSVSSRARLVAVLEAAGAIALLVPASRDPTDLSVRVPGLSMLTLFFANSVVGHATVKDKIIPIAATMFACSSSALICILFSDNSTGATTSSSAQPAPAPMTLEKGAPPGSFWIHP